MQQLLGAQVLGRGCNVFLSLPLSLAPLVLISSSKVLESKLKHATRQFLADPDTDIQKPTKLLNANRKQEPQTLNSICMT